MAGQSRRKGLWKHLRCISPQSLRHARFLRVPNKILFSRNLQWYSHDSCCAQHGSDAPWILLTANICSDHLIYVQDWWSCVLTNLCSGSSRSRVHHSDLTSQFALALVFQTLPGQWTLSPASFSAPDTSLCGHSHSDQRECLGAKRAQSLDLEDLIWSKQMFGYSVVRL